MIPRRSNNQPAEQRRGGTNKDGFPSSPPNSDESSWSSHPTLVVLHTVRLAGFAETELLAARAELPVEIVREILCALDEQKMVEKFTFADISGWILTETGKSHDAKLLQEELEASGVRPVLEKAAWDFESVNSHFVQVITEWQLRSPTGRTDKNEEILRELTDIAQELRILMKDLAMRAPRFSRYIRQFPTALEKARAGEPQWIAGTGVLSCHLVWAELHEDLLSSLGHNRSSESDNGEDN